MGNTPKQEPNYLIKRRDYADVIKLQDPGVLADFLDEPATFIAETTMGLIADGKWGWALAGGRVAQSALKAQLFRQWATEFRRWREKGRIAEDFADTRHGFQTWADLMTIIDEDSPDFDRLEALKAMFLAVNKIGASDAERLIGYQLWQIAKSLDSGELILLKAIHEQHAQFGSPNNSYREWATFMAKACGHGLSGLVDLHERKLVDFGLISPRYGADYSSISSVNARLTDLGFKFCSNIDSYRIEARE